MTLEVETIVAISMMMAVFAAVAAVGTSIVLGAGFERLRSGFEIVRKQTGFFSDAIYKLEQKVDVVDEQTGKFSSSIDMLSSKVSNVGEQANAFSDSMQKLEKKVDVVDKQAGFFGQAIHKLEQKIDLVGEHEEIVAEKIKNNAEKDLISTGKAEALVSHAENLLSQVVEIAGRNQQNYATDDLLAHVEKDMRVHIPSNLDHYVHRSDSEGEARYH